MSVRRPPLAIGDRVRLRRAAAFHPGNRQVTTIEMIFTEIHGGVVLKERLEGFYCWNFADLERAPAEGAKRRGASGTTDLVELTESALEQMRRELTQND